MTLKEEKLNQARSYANKDGILTIKYVAKVIDYSESNIRRMLDDPHCILEEIKKGPQGSKCQRLVTLKSLERYINTYY